MIKWVGLAVGLLVLIALSLSSYGAWNWNIFSQKLNNRLTSAKLPGVELPYGLPDLVGLPLPVQRYFRIVLKDGQPIIAGVKLTQTGTFNMNEDKPNWKPFTAGQRFTTRRPGFIWDARIQMFPFIAAHVHDAYVEGEGTLHVAVIGLFTVAELSGAGDLAKGELMRFLAEAPWYPTALLPSSGLKWEAIDDNTARATLTDGDVSVAMTFRFNSAGLIDTSRAEARGRAIGKTITTARWEGRYWNYAERGNVLVPLEAEVAWIMPDGPKTYFRCHVTSISYDGL